MATLLAEVLGLDGGLGTKLETDADGVLTGHIDGPFNYGEGKPVRMRELAARRGDRPGGVVGLQRLGLRPADAARGRPSGRRQPR